MTSPALSNGGIIPIMMILLLYIHFNLAKWIFGCKKVFAFINEEALLRPENLVLVENIHIVQKNSKSCYHILKWFLEFCTAYRKRKWTAYQTYSSFSFDKLPSSDGRGPEKLFAPKALQNWQVINQKISMNIVF